MTTQIVIPCSIEWSIDANHFFEDLSFPTYEEKLKFFGLPSYAELKSEDSIFDACGESLKQKLIQEHGFDIEHIKCDFKELKAEIVWCIEDDKLYDFIETCSKSLFASKAGLPEKLDLPSVFLEEASTYSELPDEFVQKVKLHLEELYAFEIAVLSISDLSELDKRKKEYEDSYISLSYSAYSSINISSVQDELGIAWVDVVDYSVKWDTLYLKMKDGRQLSYNFCNEPEIGDMKFPDCTDIV